MTVKNTKLLMNIAQKNPQGVTIDTESNSTANKYRGQKKYALYNLSTHKTPPTCPIVLPVGKPQGWSPRQSHRW